MFLHLTNQKVFSKSIREIVCEDTVSPEMSLKQSEWDRCWAAHEREGPLSRRRGIDSPITSHGQYKA